MSENGKIVFTVENLDKAYNLVQYLVGRSDLYGAEEVVGALLGKFPDDPRVHRAASYLGQYVRKRFAGLLEGGGAAVDQAHFEMYTAGIEKKIRIGATWPAFAEAARAILAEGRTLLAQDRLFTLYQAVKNVRLLAGDMLELGVYRGGAVKFMAELQRRWGMQLRIFALDTFTGHADVSPEDVYQRKSMFNDTSLEEVRAYLQGYPEIDVTPGDVRHTLSGVLQQVDLVRFAHLDMDLWEPTAFALPLIARKMGPGGVILVDDYGAISCGGVRKATDEFTAQGQFHWYYLLTGQCLLIKK